jgi:ATP-binding cassette, subfamily B, bacterial
LQTEQLKNKRIASGKPNLFGVLRPYTGKVIILLAFAIIGNGINLIIPLIISNGIDTYTNGTIVLKKVVLIFLIASALIFIFTYLQGVFQTFVSETVARDMRKRFSDKISRQSYSYILDSNPSKLLTNLTSDIDSVKMFVSMAVVSIVSSLFIIIGAGIMLLSINWRLAIVVMTIVPLIGGAFFIMFRKVKVLFKKSREVIDWLNKVINESILGSTLIRVLNSQHFEYQKFLAANTTSRDLGLSILNLFAALIPVITFVANMAVLTVLTLGGHFVVRGTMTLGDFAAFNSYISILIFPILIIGFMSNIIAMASASYQRVQTVLNEPSPVEAGTIQEKLKGLIEIKNVTLNYGEKSALKDIDITITPGSRVAIIGPTAAGKTQLLFLLTGLVKPSTGEIYYDGYLIGDFRKDAFYRQVGFVFQDSIIFNLSLRENISFSKEINDEMLEMAIRTAELGSFVETLPDKMETLISERGTSLSGGQKQRIMLARALALNPSILLLDDFTSRVDKRTERKIMDNISKNYPELTIITVTQKIASVEHYDQIILLMESEIIAKGSHETMMQSCPEYVQIYNSQRSTSHYDVQS